jgi:Ig-like domain-containing protein
MKHLPLIVSVLTLSAVPAFAFSYDSASNTYTCNGTQSDIQGAINDAAANHPATGYTNAATIEMTAAGSGTVALGVGNAAITFGTCVILTGNGNAGPNTTTVTLPSVWPGNSSTSNTNAVIAISHGAWVENFAVPQALSGTPLFSVSNGTVGARITNISYNTNASTNCSYFCFVACSGTTLTQVTIDNNLIVPGGGTNELIFTRGPIDAWQTPDRWGSADQIYIESNQFGLPGGVTGGDVCDFNANTIGTVRYNTINGPIKIDGHGAASNTPHRGVREMEIYGNSFLGNYHSSQAMEIRGGPSRNFLNTATNRAITNATSSDYISYVEYGCLEQTGTFNGVWQTPSNYPILDQVGEGEDIGGKQAPGGSDPAYMWLNGITYGPGAGVTVSWQPGSKSVPGNSPGGTFKADSNAYAVGATSINLASQSTQLVAGTYSDSHGTWQNAVAIASDNNRYTIASTTAASQKSLVIDSKGLQQSIAANSNPAIVCNAYTNWQQQTNDPNNTFTVASYVPGTQRTVILANRDIFSQTSSQWGDGTSGNYDGTQGVNYGPTAAMNSFVPTQVGVGWWVTDQGSWNTSLPPNTSGQLYIWNGSGWALSYTPYQYPYYQPYRPVFMSPPMSAAVAGGTVVLTAEANNSPTYQWYVNGTTPVPGATSSILLLPNAAAATGVYTCVATNMSGTSTSAPAAVSLADTNNIGRLTNLSYRAHVGSGSGDIVLGFATGGTEAAGSEPLLIRGSGPALAPFGVTGTLPDPLLKLFSGSALLGSNDGWGGNAAIASTSQNVGAFAWNSQSRDSAILESLAPGPYTLELSGQSGDSGVALAEVYDATPEGSFSPASPRLVNLSAQVEVNSDADIPVVGFTVGGGTSMTVLLRASGPALAQFGISGILPDPRLELSRDNGDGTSTLIGSDTGWGGSPQITAEASTVGAFSWGESATADSALLVTLPPGNYNVEVSGANGDFGLALLEVYEVP